MKNKVLFVFRNILVIIVLFLGSSLVSKNITVAPAFAQTAPTQVQNVLLTFPYNNNGQVNFTQANCTWDALAGASNYQVTITNATTNSQVLSQQVAGTVTSQVFNVQDNNTYTCSVAAINSSGTSGPSNSYSLLCKVDAAVDTPPPGDTAAPTPVPTVPATGIIGNTIMLSIGTAIFISGGLVLLLL
ncbi:MAG TPA: hypothetical protein VG965_03730 [Patescibacteria group bacterium]|nr:hypothetical protein [Patescibacteria group bacterium]